MTSEPRHSHRAGAGGGGHPVQHDGQHHDRQARVERGPDVQRLQRLHHRLAQSWRVDERGDGDHGQGCHDRLVDTEDDRALGGRQQDLGQGLAGGRTERLTGLAGVVRN
jgi:hypothetical protein